MSGVWFIINQWCLNRTEVSKVMFSEWFCLCHRWAHCTSMVNITTGEIRLLPFQWSLVSLLLHSVFYHSTLKCHSECNGEHFSNCHSVWVLEIMDSSLFSCVAECNFPQSSMHTHVYTYKRTWMNTWVQDGIFLFFKVLNIFGKPWCYY